MSHSLVRNVGVLVGGTAFAQALMVLILPVLTRLYSPQDFAVLAVYASILGVFSGIACLRFEIAIPVPKEDGQAAGLLFFALLGSFLMAGTLGVLVLLYPVEIARLTGQPGFEKYLWLLPLGVWVSGTYSALQYWATRNHQFSIIAKTRITQAISAATIQLGSGWLGYAPFGLLLGHMVNGGAGLIALAVPTWKNDLAKISSLRAKALISTLKQYRRYPTYSTLESLANGANIQVPVLIIAALIAGPEVGFLMLAMRIMAAPMRLIGGAVSQVFLSRAPQQQRDGLLAKFTEDVLGGLVKAGVGPLFYAGIVAPFVFPFAFGSDWGRAGELVSWMTPWLILQFLASPISMLLHITNNQKKALFLQFLGLLIRVGFVLSAFYITPAFVSEFYCVSGFVFYAIYFAVVLRVAGVNRTALKHIFLSAQKNLIFWVFLAGLTLWIFSVIEELI